jgi:hypothetical protein
MDGMNDVLNLRPGGATREKRSIIGWEGQRVECGYSRLQGGSPRLCWLRTIHSGSLNEHLIDRMPDLWVMINRHSSMIVVVGRYPINTLEMSIGIVYMPPMDSLACGIAWMTCTRERWDPDRPYSFIAKGCHTWPIRGCARMLCWSGFYPYRVVYWFGSPRHSRIWVIACSLPPTRRNACLLLWWI